MRRLPVLEHRRSIARSLARAALFALAALAACTDSTPPLVPTTLTLSQPSVAFDALGSAVSVTVSVDDQDGNPMQNEPVTWTPSSSAVRIEPSTGAAPSTSTGGYAAQAGGGIVARTVTITAVSAGSASITVTARSISLTLGVNIVQVPTPPIKSAGDLQTGIVGSALPEPLRVRIQDRLGNPISGVAVSFAAQGGGSVAPAAATTAADGTASVFWTLGTRTSDPQQVVATAFGTSANATFSATPQPGPVASHAIHDGDGQAAIVGSQVPLAPSTRVSDQFGNAVPGQTVTFAVTGGGGTVSVASAVTNASGIASAGSWTLGPTPGANTLSATTATGIAVSFAATAIVGPPAQVSVQAGNGQSVAAGAAVPVAPSVTVVDVFGNPVPDIGITFAVTGGGGSITGAAATTNAAGVAAVGSWTLGAAPGANTMTATAAGDGIIGNPVTFTATGTGGGGGGGAGGGAGFNITLRFLTTLSPSQTAAFNNAAAKWSTIITGDVADIGATVPGGTCGSNSTPINEVIDDVLIFATIAPIDGPGNILGQAGWCFIRAAGGLPVIGAMIFDAADVATMEADGSFTSVVLHEMGHVLGIGSLWDVFGLLQNPSPVGGPPLDTFFSGPNGIAGFNAIGGTTYTGGQKVPVENMFGAGTINSHWREAVLQNELMTGFLDAGANPLSQLTARSLQDLGYVVNAGAADAFLLTLTLRAPGATDVPKLDLRDDLYKGPGYTIDAQGRITRVR